MTKNAKDRTKSIRLKLPIQTPLSVSITFSILHPSFRKSFIFIIRPKVKKHVQALVIIVRISVKSATIKKALSPWLMKLPEKVVKTTRLPPEIVDKCLYKSTLIL